MKLAGAAVRVGRPRCQAAAKNRAARPMPRNWIIGGGKTPGLRAVSAALIDNRRRVVAVDHAAFHHEVDGSQGADVLGRVGFDGHDVGVFAGL